MILFLILQNYFLQFFSKILITANVKNYISITRFFFSVILNLHNFKFQTRKYNPLFNCNIYPHTLT